MKKILFFFFLFTSFFGHSQEKKGKAEWKRDTVIGTNRFALYNNWFSLGGGIGINTNANSQQFTGTVAYNFHIKKNYFKLGVLLSGNAFASYTTKEIHFCYGKRKENTKMNFSYFGGLSFSEIYNNKSFKYKGAPGIYIETEYIRKVTYDVGLGPALFTDVNIKQTIIGLKLDIYFSGAYKGTTK